MSPKFDLRPMPLPCSEALIALARSVETASIGHIRFRGFPDIRIRPVTSVRERIVGTAVTLALPGFDSTLLHHAAGLARPGDILLIDRLGDTRYACLGGGVAGALVRSGAVAAIIDGPCTDPDELEASGLAVWSTAVTAITTRIPGYGGALNVPISIGGAVVHPGDLVIADAAGIVILPIDEAETALLEAGRLQATAEALLNGPRKNELLGDLTGASNIIRKADNITQ